MKSPTTSAWMSWGCGPRSGGGRHCEKVMAPGRPAGAPGEDDILVCMRTLVAKIGIATLLIGVPAALRGQTAKDDMKDAGHAAKNAAKDTGHAAKSAAKGTGHAAKTAGHKTKKHTKKTVHKAAKKVEQKTQ